MMLLYLLFVCLFAVDARVSPFSHLRAGNYRKSTEEDCNSDKLTCVLMKDCAFECPPNFKIIGGSGACYYAFDAAVNDPRTFNEAQDYCEGISDSLLWIEDYEELANIMEDPTITDPVYLNAVYSRDKHAWVWDNNYEKVEWNIILQSLPNKAALVTAIENAPLNSCFMLNAITDTVDIVPCTGEGGYVCKMGKSDGKCTKTGQTKCCYKPTFDFFLRNQQFGHDPGLELGPDGCQMKVGTDLFNCNSVLDAIPLTSVESLTRIGSSYFYFTDMATTCEIREAVISNTEAHEYAMLYMATREISFASNNVKIGLTFNQDGDAHWSNGKSEDFYKTFWFPGEPIRDAAVDGGCAAYSRVPDTFTYLWKLYTQIECDAMMKICELPVFRSPVSRLSTKDKCGKRKERGVLAKSYYPIYDTDEATFGEFPWHAAVSYYDKVGSGAKRVFACSGALINERFVLTSAHCVGTIRHSDIVVTLGEHDLKDDETLLEPVVFEVTDTIFHPGYGDYHTYSDDVALLQLKENVNVEEYPHVSLGCLPSPHHIQSHSGKWECFSVGWPKQDYGSRRVLNRVDVSFTSEEVCRNYNSDYYKSLYYQHSRKKYNEYESDLNTAHLYSSSDPELLCARPNYHSTCVDDSTSILVCKKETNYVRKPFFSTSNRDSYEDFYESESQKYGEQKHVTEKQKYKEHSRDSYRQGRSRVVKSGSKYGNKRSRDYHNKVDYIINTYGEDRFDADTWYIIGVGHGSSQCGKSNSYDTHRSSKISGSNTQVYSSVYEYLPFIHYVIDLYHTQA